MKNTKIHTLESLKKKVKRLQAEEKKIVLCHGHFNVIHPGHLRFLRFAKEQGDYLIVSILAQPQLDPKWSQEFFCQDERVDGVAALDLVDSVYKLPGPVTDLISVIKPHFYVKGREFEKNQEIIEDEIKEVRAYGGSVIFSSGEVEYSSFKFYNADLNQDDLKKNDFLKISAKHNVSLEKLQFSLNDFKNLKFLVIGDTIVDQFVACDTLGISSEAPVLAIRELQSKEFIGGASIVALHLRSMGAQCHYCSVIGHDGPGELVKTSLETAGVSTYLLTDEGRPTTYKIRYLVDGQKVLRVSRLKQHAINSEMEKKIINHIENIVPKVNGIIISDFVYGVITPKICQVMESIAAQHNVLIFGDLQCSSQVGDVSKFKNIHLITPTEKEARIAMGDYTSGLESLAFSLLEKTKNKNLAITLGGQGLLAYSKNNQTPWGPSEFFPALENNPVDVAGAGDALLAGYALSLCLGLNIFEASVLASCMSGISVMRIGNIPIQQTEMKTYLEKLIFLKDNIGSLKDHYKKFSNTPTTISKDIKTIPSLFA